MHISETSPWNVNADYALHRIQSEDISDGENNQSGMRGENYGTFMMSPQIQVEVVNHTKPKTHVKTKTGKSNLKQQ